MKWDVLFLVLSIIAGSQAKQGFGPGEQDYGYVTVRTGAHMFWWMYHTTANVPSVTDRPIIIWLQGGPGGSSCGYGNFEILGPLDLELKPREFTWVNDFNLLLIDNPVGTGYSYVDSLTYLAKDNAQVAKDLVVLMKNFYDQLPQFKNVPVYIYGQSYGGKMALDFALLMYKEQQANNIPSNVKGIAMGNSWISPIDSVLTWGPLLYSVSLVDKAGEEAINKQANKTKATFDRGDYYQSTVEWGITENVVLQKTEGVDFYNFLTKATRRGMADNGRTVEERLFDKHTHSKYSSKEAYDLDVLMNGPVKTALGIPSKVKWGSQSNSVFNAMYVDFMKPVTSVVETILNTTTITVQVYNGNLDVIVDTPGQKSWVDNIRWPKEVEYRKAKRVPVWVNNTLEGYKRIGGNFQFQWVNVAGHSVPADNPAAARSFLRDMTGV